jgi:3-hydroxyacyl-CoA dehydrogenase
VERFIVEESARMGIQRRPMTEDDIIKRCLYGMINEGAKLLEQGVALRPETSTSPISRATAFPPTMGARCTWPTASGLDKVLADIRRFHAQDGFWWTPAPLLEKLAREGQSFADLQLVD